MKLKKPLNIPKELIFVIASFLIMFTLSLVILLKYLKPNWYTLDIVYLVNEGCSINEILEEAKKYNGVILDQNMLIYFDEKTDITKEIKERLNSCNPIQENN